MMLPIRPTPLNARRWTTGRRHWAPLLTLGGSVIAALVMIGGSLSLMGTAGAAKLPAAAAAPAARVTAPALRQRNVAPTEGAAPGQQRLASAGGR